ncbi:MAG TPA: hypothetical protein VFK02_09440 [Kofleriaceae bacterium]|nr:hypothetical protein [Kofleriaceae bacterium]
MGRGMQIAVVSAVVVGSVGGGIAALKLSPGTSAPPADRAAASHASTSSGSSASPPSAPTPAKPALAQAAAADPAVVLGTLMKTVLGRFIAWSRDHAGAPCPDLTALGVVALDPWGHAIALTCTDQPADQQVGAVSAGPDGVHGSADDVASWTLGGEVTELVRGPRWRGEPAAAPAPPIRPSSGRRHRDAAAAHDRGSASPGATASSAHPPATPGASAAPRAPGGDSGSDDIPTQR